MSAKKYVSEGGVNRILEKAETVEEAAQIVRDAKFVKDIEADVAEADVVTSCSSNSAENMQKSKENM